MYIQYFFAGTAYAFHQIHVF